MSMRHRFVPRLAIAALAPLVPLATPTASAQSDHYAGQTIELVVPFAAGGAVELTARLLAPVLERHIAGNPSIEITTRPGGGSILGTNWFAQNAEPDGYTILLTSSSSANPYILGLDEVEYDLPEMPVAFAVPLGAVAYVAPATGVETIQDLKDPPQPLIYGGIAAAASDLPALLSFEVLDIPVRAVLGFTGRGPVRLAFERGETNFDYQFGPVYAQQVTEDVAQGKAIELWTGGTVAEDGRLTARDPIAPHLPSVYEVYTTLYDQEPGGNAWEAFQKAGAIAYNYAITAYLPAGTDPEIVKIFDDAVAAINDDPEFQQGSDDLLGGYSLIAGSDAEGPLKDALELSDELHTYLRDLLAEKYDVEF